MKNWNAIHWYQEQEQKRKEQIRKHDIRLINQQLKRLLSVVRHHIDWKKYQKVVNRLEVEYRIGQSSIWDLSWANHLESEQAALAQGLLIAHIVKYETHPDVERWNHEVDILMRRLGNVDWGIYLQYGQLKKRI